MKRSADQVVDLSEQPAAKKARKSKKSKTQSTAIVSATNEFFKDSQQKDFSNLKLKTDHATRPCWVCPDKHIFLETFSPVYRVAYDFMVAIAEPVSRPEHFHEYLITEYSLYAAVSIGLETETIIKVLDRFSKVKLDDAVVNFIHDCTTSFGKVKLVLHKNTFFVESQHENVLLALLQDKDILDAARLINAEKAQELGIKNYDAKSGLLIRYRTAEEMSTYKTKVGEKSDEQEEEKKQTGDLLADISEAFEADEDLDLSQKDLKLYSFEVEMGKVGQVKKRAIELNYPMLEEYDFDNDTVNASLKIDLQKTTAIRSYQAKSLNKMFGNGRAHSGIIVLPCGAGKTLVGVAAACNIKKSTLVLCINSVSVEQWRNQFLLWADIETKSIKRFMSNHKEELSKDPCILVTTYNMITYTRERGAEGKKIMEAIQSREWGLMILDEVHVVPAETFKRVIEVVKAHCKLGLTATLLREDGKTDELYHLIGPKMYEANWLDLQRNGHLAKVQCIEIWCPMTPEFYKEYLKASMNVKKLLYDTNPNKFKALEFLVRTHEARGDKVIIFSDNLFSLKEFAIKMKKPFIYGETPQQERMDILTRFRTSTSLNSVFISKVGDTAIDLPEATVIIQISSQYGSRRQETQRLGRILRPKPTHGRSFLGIGGQANAYFYSLVSQDTSEMYYATKRQQFLVNQGYSFQVKTDLHEFYSNSDKPFAYFNNKAEELDFLSKVLSADETAAKETLPKDEDDISNARTNSRRKGTMASASGGGDRVYSEKKSKSSSFKELQSKHPLYKKK